MVAFTKAISAITLAGIIEEPDLVEIFNSEIVQALRADSRIKYEIIKGIAYYSRSN